MEFVDFLIIVGIVLALIALRFFIFGPPDDGDGGSRAPWD
jgi:hypothetical protein